MRECCAENEAEGREPYRAGDHPGRWFVAAVECISREEPSTTGRQGVVVTPARRCYCVSECKRSCRR